MPICFCFGRLVEEAFGENVLCHKDYSCEKGAEDAKDIATEFGGASQYYTEGERYQ
jgi:hypothetical protein